MPFEAIGKARSRVIGVKIAKNKTHSLISKVMIRVVVSNEVLEKLDWNTTVDILWGTNGDKGFIKIVEIPEGMTMTREEKKDHKHSYRFFATPRVPKDAQHTLMTSREVEYKIEGKTLLITLPDEFYAKEKKETL